MYELLPTALEEKSEAPVEAAYPFSFFQANSSEALRFIPNMMKWAQIAKRRLRSIPVESSQVNHCELTFSFLFCKEWRFDFDI